MVCRVLPALRQPQGAGGSHQQPSALMRTADEAWMGHEQVQPPQHIQRQLLGNISDQQWADRARCRQHMNFSKVFDTVPHSVLLDKMFSMQVDKCII